MLYPINYDFGYNWDTKIVPYLTNSKIKKAIRKGVNSLKLLLVMYKLFLD